MCEALLGKGGSRSRKTSFPETTIAFSKIASYGRFRASIQFCLLKQLLKGYRGLPSQKETGEVRGAT